MSRQVVLDAALLAKLSEIVYPVEFVDPAGNVVGQFTPTFDRSKWEEVGGDVSNDELDRLLASDQRRFTPEEVISHLRSLK